MLETIFSFSGAIFTIVIIIFLLFINSWIFDKLKTVISTKYISENLVSIAILLIGTLIFILSLPIDKNLKGQILSFLGIIISAGIALSSTTILGNLIAGFMNSTMNRSMKNGSMIKVNDIQGRVTSRGVFHTEIQLEDSNFISFPNLFVASNPIKIYRDDKTVISTTVSLGYDVSRTIIEKALKKAATDTNLTDPYVYITDLGDFSITYKIHGFLDNSDKYYSTHSLLNCKVLDALHEEKIEIVSPTFMNQRKSDETIFIPRKEKKVEIKQTEHPEDKVFDEAIKSEKVEQKVESLDTLEQRKSELKKELKKADDVEKEGIQKSIDRIDKITINIQENIQKLEDD